MHKRSSLAILSAVLFALVLREFRTHFNKRRMGAFWLVFEPLAFIMMMMFIRVYLRGRHIPGLDYPLFLITGLVPFMLFRNIALMGMGAIDANRSLFAYRQIKPLDCIVARVIVQCILMALVYAVLIFIMGFWAGYDVSIAHPLEWLGTLFLGVLFSFALSIILCIWAEAMPGIRTFVSLAFMPLYFLSGVMIPSWMLPVQIQHWLTWNPFFQLIEQLRIAIFPGYPVPPGISVTFVIFVTLALLLIALTLYQTRHDNLVSAT
jgi:capsular polysaccharide transport system permease protein